MHVSHNCIYNNATCIIYKCIYLSVYKKAENSMSFDNALGALLFLLSYKVSLDHIRFNIEVARLKDLREVERKGRINVQQKMREIKQAENEESGYRYAAIGLIESAFPDRRGTPRQPLLVPAARAKVRFFKKVVTCDHFKELEQFSHVWVLFVFHNNTNSDSSKNIAKIKPPRLNGEKVGCLSTRSPHRPNNIGLSVCQICKVGKDFIELIGNDMVDGTPVLDVKPYHPSDSIALDERVQSHAIYCKSKLRVPDWVVDGGIDIRPVYFPPECIQSLILIFSKKQLRFCDSVSHARQLITEVLQQDIRGVHQGRGKEIQMEVRDKDIRSITNSAALDEEETETDKANNVNDVENAATATNVVQDTSSLSFNCRLDNMSINFVTMSAGIHITSIEFSDNKLLCS